MPSIFDAIDKKSIFSGLEDVSTLNASMSAFEPLAGFEPDTIEFSPPVVTKLPDLNILGNPLSEQEIAETEVNTGIVKEYLKKGKIQDILRTTTPEDLEFIEKTIENNFLNFSAEDHRAVIRERRIREKVAELQGLYSKRAQR